MTIKRVVYRAQPVPAGIGESYTSPYRREFFIATCNTCKKEIMFDVEMDARNYLEAHRRLHYSPSIRGRQNALWQIGMFEDWSKKSAAQWKFFPS